MGAKSYNFKQVDVIVGVNQISGFADGDAIKAARNEDAFTLQMGNDGEGTRSKSNNRSGRVTLILMQSSDSNAILQAIAKADELSDSGIVPILIKDRSGATLHAAETAWVVKQPDSNMAREAGPREWIFETDNLQMFEGGNS